MLVFCLRDGVLNNIYGIIGPYNRNITPNRELLCSEACCVIASHPQMKRHTFMGNRNPKRVCTCHVSVFLLESFCACQLRFSGLVFLVGLEVLKIIHPFALTGTISKDSHATYIQQVSYWQTKPQLAPGRLKFQTVFLTMKHALCRQMHSHKL